MKKHIEWWALVLLGLALHFLGVPLAGDIVGGFIAVFGDILFVVGVIQLIIKIFKKK